MKPKGHLLTSSDCLIEDYKTRRVSRYRSDDYHKIITAKKLSRKCGMERKTDLGVPNGGVTVVLYGSRRVGLHLLVISFVVTLKKKVKNRSNCRSLHLLGIRVGPDR